MNTSQDTWLTHVRASFFAAVTLLAIVSGVYPLIVWGLSQAIFHHQANGSLIPGAGGQPIGSELIGQAFAGEKYFQPRPSAAGSGYDPSGSGGTNLGPTSAKLLHGDGDFPGVEQLAIAYRKLNGLAADADVPADAVTRSASGIDPHIGVANARIQAARVAKVRGISMDRVLQLVDAHTDNRDLGFLGEAGVNVLKLNLALDGPR